MKELYVRLLGKRRERKRQWIWEMSAMKERWITWVFLCQNLNTQRLIFQGVDGALDSNA